MFAFVNSVNQRFRKKATHNCILRAALFTFMHYFFFPSFFSTLSVTWGFAVSRRWSWVIVRRPRLWPCGCCCLCPSLTSIASMKWTVTMVTQWSTRSSSSPSALWDIICWKWVTPWTLCFADFYLQPLLTIAVKRFSFFPFFCREPDRSWLTGASLSLSVPVLVTLLLLDPLAVSVIELCDGCALKWILSDLMKHWAPAESHSTSDHLYFLSLPHIFICVA